MDTIGEGETEAESTLRSCQVQVSITDDELETAEVPSSMPLATRNVGFSVGSQPEYTGGGENFAVTWNDGVDVGTSLTPGLVLEAGVQTSQCMAGVEITEISESSVCLVDAETCVSQKDVIEDCTSMSPVLMKDESTSYSPQSPLNLKKEIASYVPSPFTDAWTSISSSFPIDSHQGTPEKIFCDADTYMSQNFWEAEEVKPVLAMGFPKHSNVTDAVVDDVSVPVGMNLLILDGIGDASGIKDFLSVPTDVDVHSASVFEATPNTDMDSLYGFNKENENLPFSQQPDEYVQVSKCSVYSATPTSVSNRRNPLRVGLSKNFKPPKPLHHRRQNQF